MREKETLPEVSRDVREILEKLEEQEERPPGIYERICRWSSALLGGITGEMEMTEETRKQLSWAGLRVTPAEWWSGFLLVVLVPIVATMVPWLALFALGVPLLSLWYLPILGLTLSGLLGAAFYYYPVSTADMERSEAQSRAIETIMLMSFALHHRPDLRGAAIFAANASEGKLAEDIREGLLELDQRRSYESIRQMFTVIAHRWREVDEGVRRAIFDILRSTGQSEESLRRQDVAQAPERVLESSERQLGSRLDSLVMPTMTFMVFGSLVIVGVIGLSPIYGMIGMNFIDIKYFAMAAGTIVASFLAFTVFIGRRRPATLPPPRIPPDDPRVPPPGKAWILGRAVPTWIPTALIFTIMCLPGIMYLGGIFTSSPVVSVPNTFWIIWAAAGTISAYAYLMAGPRADIREQVREATEDWSMALNVIGSRVLDGRPMRQAMRETSEIMTEAEVGRRLGQATTTMEKFSADPNYAFFETGIARQIYNPLVASLLGVITRVKRGSERAAGRASMLAADFLDTLNEVERRFGAKIGDATGNLWLMAIILLPVVSALSVWIMDFMGKISIATSATAERAGLSNVPLLTGSLETVEIALLKLVMGLTVIALIVIVARHISVIRSGRDPIEFWDRLPWMVLTGTAIYTLAYLGFSILNIVGL